MKLSYGSGGQLDFRRKKKSPGRWIWRLILAVALTAVVARWIAPVVWPVAPESGAIRVETLEPRVIQMN
ncbi:MAG: hypothetical protein RLZZ528_2009 [Pseudomonadota bacterium]|jgi:hypothetical protein